jgi:hypothetical protein
MGVGKGCPYGNYWTQVFAAVRHTASCTGSGVEVLAGEQVHRYSFSIRPRRQSFLAKLSGKEKHSSLAKLHAHLNAHGTDRIKLNIRLAHDQTACRAIGVMQDPQ